MRCDTLLLSPALASKRNLASNFSQLSKPPSWPLFLCRLKRLSWIPAKVNSRPLGVWGTKGPDWDYRSYYRSLVTGWTLRPVLSTELHGHLRSSRNRKWTEDEAQRKSMCLAWKQNSTSQHHENRQQWGLQNCIERGKHLPAMTVRATLDFLVQDFVTFAKILGSECECHVYFLDKVEWFWLTHWF